MTGADPTFAAFTLAAAYVGTAPQPADREFSCTVYGTPAPQGSKRHVGNGRMIESSAKVAPWREAVKWAALNERVMMMPGPLTGPLAVTIAFTLPKPASAPKRTVTYPAKRPDLDKLIRSTFDALGEAFVWKDDAQVVLVTATKVYPQEGANALEAPGARIWVSQVAE
jgi:Holliday junction resolvase RusA-like endonuclease